MRLMIRSLLVCVLVLSGCSRSQSGGAAKSAKGSAARSEERLVVMSPAIAVMLRDIGMEDSIVGKHAWDMVLSGSVPIVGSEEGIDYEALIRAEPTQIFFQRSSAGVPAKLQSLAEEHGWVIRTVALDSLDDIAIGADDLFMQFVGVRERAPDEIDPTARFSETTMPSEALARAWADRGPIADEVGRVLVLAGVDPPGAMGPGSFHYQLVVRLGAVPAITDGGMWQELDLEDIVRLNPDGIVLFSPRQRDASDLFAPIESKQSDHSVLFGRIAELRISAVRNNRLAVIDDPLALVPGTNMGRVGEELGEIFERWARQP
ncbi:MAG: ABC transporter substrate-binding protein [Phycisphaerales bacterium]|nr:ABC transporter substrate-binding protein [Phycisphaerales bacterium]